MGSCPKLSSTTSSKLFFAAAMAVITSALISTVHLRFSSSSYMENLSDGKSDSFRFQISSIPGAAGPESLAFDGLGRGPYTGISDGRIIKWEENRGLWIDFAVTSPERNGCGGPHDHDQTEHICGRPLGLGFDQRTGDLYIGDAYLGLLRVGPCGGLATQLATEADGIPFRFINGLDIDQQSGAVYFSDSSSRYQRRNYMSIILSGERTGRIIKYDPKSEKVEVVLENLSYPNGVVLSQDGDFILVAESSRCRILRYWLKTSKAGILEVFAQVPGFPDNIKRSPRGGYWVGLFTRKEKIVELVLSYPWIGNALLKLPLDIMKVHSFISKWRCRGFAVRLGENGQVLQVFEDKVGNRWRSISEVQENDGTLWIGSVTMSFVGKYMT